MMKRLRTFIVLSVLVSFIGSSVQMPAFAQIDPMPFMPKPGVMVPLSPQYTPAYLKGIIIHPENALKFDFIIYKGDKPLTDAQKRDEYTKLTKYFLASLAIPDDDQWVNLSPYEKDRVIKDDFGKTEMGRDLLAQDYLLKQITASLIYPESQIGKAFWAKVYAQAQKQYGTTNIPVNTFNKVWILPDDALIYEKGNTAYVLKNHLRVMLEEDYLSLQKHSGIESTPTNKTHSIASKIVREIVLPELQKEVNEDANFAPLRQVYSGMLLATWFKRTLKQSLLGQIYANKAKVKGVDQDPKTNEEIYRQYLKAYKKGVFNFIKEDTNRLTNETIPRKYFSGGTIDYAMAKEALNGRDPLQITNFLNTADAGMLTGQIKEEDIAQVGLSEDKTMTAVSPEILANNLFNSMEKSVNEALQINGQREVRRYLLQSKIFWKYIKAIENADDVKAFANHLKEKWDRSDLRSYGPLFRIAALNIDHMFIGRHDQITSDQKYDWLYAFLSAADKDEQAISLWLVVVADIMHLRAFGMHPEWNIARQQLVFYDLETVFGNDRHAGVLAKYMQAVQELGSTGRLDKNRNIEWAISLARDPTIHNPKYLLREKTFPGNVEVLRGSLDADTFMIQSLRKNFGYVLSVPGAGRLIRASMDITEEDWKRSGYIPPQRFWAPDYLTSYYVHNGFPENMFAFLRADDDSMKRYLEFASSKALNQLSKSEWNQALREFNGDLGDIYHKAWTLMGDIKETSMRSESAVQRNIDEIEKTLYGTDVESMDRAAVDRLKARRAELLRELAEVRALRADRAMNSRQVQEHIRRAYWALHRVRQIELKVGKNARNVVNELLKEARDQLVQLVPLYDDRVWKLWAYLMNSDIALSDDQQWKTVYDSLRELNDHKPLAEPGEYDVKLNSETQSQELSMRLLSVIVHFKHARVILPGPEKQQVMIRRESKGVYFIEPFKLSRGGVEIKNHGSDKGFMFGIQKSTGRFLLINEVKRSKIAVRVDDQLIAGENDKYGVHFIPELPPQGANIDITFSRLTIHLRFQGGALFLREAFKIPVKKDVVFIVGGENVLQIDLPFANYDNLGFLSFGDHPLQLFYTPFDAAMGADAAMLTPGMRSTKTVLVVDDNQERRQENIRALEDIGYRVASANQGEEGLRLLKSQHFDLAFLDEEMGGDGVIRQEMRRIWKEKHNVDFYPPGEFGWDGSELLKAMRADPKLENIPVVFRTSTADALLKEKRFSSHFPNAEALLTNVGAQAVFGKDAPMQEVIQKVDSLLFPAMGAIGKDAAMLNSQQNMAINLMTIRRNLSSIRQAAINKMASSELKTVIDGNFEKVRTALGQIKTQGASNLQKFLLPYWDFVKDNPNEFGEQRNWEHILALLDAMEQEIPNPQAFTDENIANIDRLRNFMEEHASNLSENQVRALIDELNIQHVASASPDEVPSNFEVLGPSGPMSSQNARKEVEAGRALLQRALHDAKIIYFLVRSANREITREQMKDMVFKEGQLMKVTIREKGPHGRTGSMEVRYHDHKADFLGVTLPGEPNDWGHVKSLSWDDHLIFPTLLKVEVFEDEMTTVKEKVRVMKRPSLSLDDIKNRVSRYRHGNMDKHTLEELKQGKYFQMTVNQAYNNYASFYQGGLKPKGIKLFIDGEYITTYPIEGSVHTGTVAMVFLDEIEARHQENESYIVNAHLNGVQVFTVPGNAAMGAKKGKTDRAMNVMDFLPLSPNHPLGNWVGTRMEFLRSAYNTMRGDRIQTILDKIPQVVSELRKEAVAELKRQKVRDRIEKDGRPMTELEADVALYANQNISPSEFLEIRTARRIDYRQQKAELRQLTGRNIKIFFLPADASEVFEANNQQFVVYFDKKNNAIYLPLNMAVKGYILNPYQNGLLGYIFFIAGQYFTKESKDIDFSIKNFEHAEDELAWVLARRPKPNANDIVPIHFSDGSTVEISHVVPVAKQYGNLLELDHYSRENGDVSYWVPADQLPMITQDILKGLKIDLGHGREISFFDIFKRYVGSVIFTPHLQRTSATNTLEEALEGVILNSDQVKQLGIPPKDGIPVIHLDSQWLAATVGFDATAALIGAMVLSMARYVIVHNGLKLETWARNQDLLKENKLETLQGIMGVWRYYGNTQFNPMFKARRSTVEPIFKAVLEQFFLPTFQRDFAMGARPQDSNKMSEREEFNMAKEGWARLLSKSKHPDASKALEDLSKLKMPRNPADWILPVDEFARKYEHINGVTQIAAFVVEAHWSGRGLDLNELLGRVTNEEDAAMRTTITLNGRRYKKADTEQVINFLRRLVSRAKRHSERLGDSRNEVLAFPLGDDMKSIETTWQAVLRQMPDQLITPRRQGGYRIRYDRIIELENWLVDPQNPVIKKINQDLKETQRSPVIEKEPSSRSRKSIPPIWSFDIMVRDTIVNIMGMDTPVKILYQEANGDVIAATGYYKEATKNTVEAALTHYRINEHFYTDGKHFPKFLGIQPIKESEISRTKILLAEGLGSLKVDKLADGNYKPGQHLRFIYQNGNGEIQMASGVFTQLQYYPGLGENVLILKKDGDVKNTHFGTFDQWSYVGPANRIFAIEVMAANETGDASRTSGGMTFDENLRRIRNSLLELNGQYYPFFDMAYRYRLLPTAQEFREDLIRADLNRLWPRPTDREVELTREIVEEVVKLVKEQSLLKPDTLMLINLVELTRKAKEILDAGQKYKIVFRTDIRYTQSRAVRIYFTELEIDKAMSNPTGGIDLNSANLTLHIKRDGNGVPLPLAQQDWAQLSNIQGLDPVILSIKPASQTELFSQLIAQP